MASLLEEIFKGFADAVTDIREKVIEEPWFGRPVSERDASAPRWPQPREEHVPERAELERERSKEFYEGIDR